MRTVSKTRVFAAGISDYSSPPLRLRFAADNATEFIAALGMETGCAIPQEHLVLLTDAAASRQKILDRLKESSSACTDDDIFIFYFSGHGERTSSDFCLLPVGADPLDLENTAITTVHLGAALNQCRARGLLVILDCCRGAGFAENADRFFMTLGGSGFRLLLSASRANQPSFEFESQKGTIFSVDVAEAFLNDPYDWDGPHEPALPHC